MPDKMAPTPGDGGGRTLAQLMVESGAFAGASKSILRAAADAGRFDKMNQQSAALAKTMAGAFARSPAFDAVNQQSAALAKLMAGTETLAQLVDSLAGPSLVDHSRTLPLRLPVQRRTVTSSSPHESLDVQQANNFTDLKRYGPSSLLLLTILLFEITILLEQAAPEALDAANDVLAIPLAWLGVALAIALAMYSGRPKPPGSD